MPNHSTISTATYRVELSPALDLWMRGARFGTVIREYNGKGRNNGKRICVVQMDHPQVKRPVRILSDYLTVIHY